MSTINPPELNQLPFPKLTNRGTTPVLMNIATVSFIATERWYLEYVSCFSNADRIRMILPKTTFIKTTKNDVSTEMNLMKNSSLFVVSPLSSIESFKILSPKLIPKAIHSAKNVIV